jgi:hypothetical protein
MLKNIFLGALAIGVTGAIGFGVYAYKSPIAAITSDQHAEFDPELRPDIVQPAIPPLMASPMRETTRCKRALARYIRRTLLPPWRPA